MEHDQRIVETREPELSPEPLRNPVDDTAYKVERPILPPESDRRWLVFVYLSFGPVPGRGADRPKLSRSS